MRACKSEDTSGDTSFLPLCVGSRNETRLVRFSDEVFTYQAISPTLALLICFVWWVVCLFKMVSGSGVQAAVDLTVFLLLSPQCWENRRVPPCPAMVS